MVPHPINNRYAATAVVLVDPRRGLREPLPVIFFDPRRLAKRTTLLPRLGEERLLEDPDFDRAFRFCPPMLLDFERGLFLLLEADFIPLAMIPP